MNAKEALKNSEVSVLKRKIKQTKEHIESLEKIDVSNFLKQIKERSDNGYYYITLKSIGITDDHIGEEHADEFNSKIESLVQLYGYRARRAELKENSIVLRIAYDISWDSTVHVETLYDKIKRLNTELNDKINKLPF